MTETPPRPRLNILLIEDHAALADTLAEYLGLQGHRVDCAGDGALGLGMALEQDYDLLLLDLNLPRLDGLQVCARLRAESERHVPVLMLTARDQLQDKLAGFAQGADDYLSKPFELAELAARCLALAARPRLQRPHLLVLGELSLDRRRREARRQGQVLPLQPLGWQILLALAEAHPALLSREALTRRLWGDEPPDSDALRSHIYQLRQALDKPFPDRPPLLSTLPGQGYRLELPA